MSLFNRKWQINFMQLSPDCIDLCVYLARCLNIYGVQTSWLSLVNTNFSIGRWNNYFECLPLWWLCLSSDSIFFCDSIISSGDIISSSRISLKRNFFNSSLRRSEIRLYRCVITLSLWWIYPYIYAYNKHGTVHLVFQWVVGQNFYFII